MRLNSCIGGVIFLLESLNNPKEVIYFAQSFRAYFEQTNIIFTNLNSEKLCQK